MYKYNILITGVGGCGVGEGLYKSLLPIPDFNLFTCNNSNNSIFLFDDPVKSFIVPSAANQNYCSTILTICNENNIKFIIPGSEHELLALVKSRYLFTANGITVFANTEDVIKVFNNKWETYLLLSSLAIKTPSSTIDSDDEIFLSNNPFPLVVKPIVGNASKNVFIVENREELESICNYLSIKNILFIIQEYVGMPSEEYTISVLSDFDGKYLGSIVLKRILAGGFSQFIECEKFREIDIIACEIAQKVNSRGPLNIQCRMINGELYVFEINPRFSGTSPFRTLLGFNEANILLRKVAENLDIFKITDIKYGSFGIRGFQEKIYTNKLKSAVLAKN